MKNRGFTLVELLAIIVILGLITLIAIPNITKVAGRKEKADNAILKERIENAAKLYTAKYYADKLVTATSGDVASFTLDQLQIDGLINLKSNQCSGLMGSTITVKVESGKIKYDYSNINAASCWYE